MASEVGKVPPAEDTVVGEEAVTQVGEGWPVADLYLVEQDGGSSDDVEEPATSETVVLAQTEPVTSPARRLLPESAGHRVSPILPSPGHGPGGSCSRRKS